jgi:hypothetical protein
LLNQASDLGEHSPGYPALAAHLASLHQVVCQLPGASNVTLPGSGRRRGGIFKSSN